MIKTSKETQKKVIKHSLIVDFFLDLSKSIPSVTANKIKTGFKLQPKFIATVRRRVSLTIKIMFPQCRNIEPDYAKYLSILNQAPVVTSTFTLTY